MRAQAAIFVEEEEEIMDIIEMLKRPKACNFQALEVQGRAEIRFINIIWMSAFKRNEETLAKMKMKY